MHPGDTVQATLVVGDDSYLESVSVTEARGAADLSSTSPVHLPQTGRNGLPTSASSTRTDAPFTWRSSAESRCSHLHLFPLPLPDYCVRMSNNFVEVAKILQSSNPAAFAKLQMLSITLDPEFDDPKILRAYGKNYAGAVDPNLKHWNLATAFPADIRKTAEYFGLSYEKQSGEVVHNLRTALLDADGNISELYLGNQWKPADVAAQLQELQK